MWREHCYYEYKKIHTIEPRYWKKKKWYKKIFQPILAVASVIPSPIQPVAIAASVATGISEQRKAEKKAKTQEEEYLRQYEEYQKRNQEYISPEITPERQRQILQGAGYFTMTDQETQKIQQMIQTQTQATQQETRAITDRQTTALQDISNFIKDLSKSALSTYQDIQFLKSESQSIKNQIPPADFRRADTQQEGLNIKKLMPIFIIGAIALFLIIRRRK